ncbi:hypothetical protein HKD37_19G052945 [Glycine soja]
MLSMPQKCSKHFQKLSKTYNRFEAASFVGESKTSPLNPALEESIRSRYWVKAFGERTRDDSTRLETLLTIIRVEIVASCKKKGKHQVVVHMIRKRLSNSYNYFHKVRMRFV